ncbi:hypothetical protein J7J95_01905 [bacterium]|nr:hypothetical protein [bacterium]
MTKAKIMVIILVISLFLSTLQSTYFFIIQKKLSLTTWFFFNACAPANISFLLGVLFFLFKRNSFLLYLSIPAVFILGLAGLIIFSWSKPVSQLGHIFMLLNVGWVIWRIFKTKDFQLATLGLLVGFLLFSIFFSLQQRYILKHRNQFLKVMPMRLHY